MTEQEKEKVWASKLEKFNYSMLELFDLVSTDLLEGDCLLKALEMLTEIIDAKYAALALVDENHKVTDFLHVGISQKIADKIGHLPEGKGLLGVVIEENRTINLEDISKDPQSCGFPPHHPAMKSLLATPVSYKNQVFGRVYLSEKRNGEPFSQQDEKLLTSFARLLGLIIRNKNASEKVADLNKELVSASHKSGKAEVSASILHNLGNIMNSLTVSAQMLQDRVAELKAEKLTSTIALLQADNQGLNPSEAEKQKEKIISYLILLAEHIGNEKTDILNEINRINENIQTIREVISQYQLLNQKVNVWESISISKKIRNVLSLEENRLARHHIAVEVNNSITEHVTLERVKLQQILLNLVSNAIDSLTKSANDNRRLSISAYHEGSDTICLQIQDNGIGIKTEDLTNVFNFAYAKKDDSCGFGLHTCALAAHEMGGEIFAASEGPGHGATFTLKLPLKDFPKKG